MRYLLALLLILPALIAGCGDDGGEVVDSGIDGLVLAGPTCPVERENPPCPDRPLSAPIRMIGDRSATDPVSPPPHVVDVQSDEQGRFRVTLEPGLYEVQPLPIPGQTLPAPGQAEEVTVEAGEYASVTVTYDTGIR